MYYGFNSEKCAQLVQCKGIIMSSVLSFKIKKDSYLVVMS